MENLSIHSVQTDNYEIEIKTYRKRKHLVVPVVMMVEGVHNGSKGKLLHKSEDLGKFIESWNGIPIVIQHPEKNGKFISANSPDVLDLQHVGSVFNSRIENKKLKAEAWLDEELLKEVSPKAYKSIKKGEPLDVSVGVFTEDEDEAGTYAEKQYTAVARNHRPDHLALLPGGQGACSWSDGCGIRVNSGELTFSVNSEQYKQNYQINTSGVVELIGNPVEVVINNKKEVKKMSNASDCPKCLEKVNALVANKAGKWTEADREWLLTQEETILDKLVPVEIERTIEVNKLSAEDQAALNFGKKQLKERKDEMIKSIQANTAEGTWPDAILNAMNEDTLERVSKSVKQPVDFSVNGNFVNVNSSKVAPLGGPEMETKK